MAVKRLQEFVVMLENTPGTLGQIGSRLGRAGINIEGFFLQVQGDYGLFRFVTDDPGRTERWLRKARYAHRVRPLVATSSKNRPGELGRLARRLAAAGVNIDATYHVFPRGRDALIGFSTENAAAAARALQGA